MADTMLTKLPGKWSYDQIASPDFTNVLTLQGVAWVQRKSLQLDPYNLDIETVSNEEIVIKQRNKQGEGSDQSVYRDNSVWQRNADRLLGRTKSCSHLIKVSELPATDEPIKSGLSDQDQVILIEVVSEDTTAWSARQIWCFEGEKLVQRVLVMATNGHTATGKLVYRYGGK